MLFFLLLLFFLIIVLFVFINFNMFFLVIMLDFSDVVFELRELILVLLLFFLEVFLIMIGFKFELFI